MISIRHKNQSSMTFMRPVFDEIREVVGRLPAETGGILLGSRQDYVIRRFVLDPYGAKGPSGYDPDITYLNKVVREQWDENGLELLGFVHSHPRGVSRLSGDRGNGIGDLGYLRRIFAAMPLLPRFLVPVVYSTADGGEFEVFPHIAHRDAIDAYETAAIELVDTYEISRSVDRSKLAGAIDLQRMAGSHIVGVGAGGASGLYEDLCRSGLGQLTVVDFDHVDDTNMATQGYDVREIGQPKVGALGRRIRALSPDIRYTGIERDLLALNETELDDLFSAGDLLLFMTDNFNAQALGNRIALRLRKPAIFALVYERARCAEMTFIIPGVTPACHRCAVSPRYRAAADGAVTALRQERTTPFHAAYLNAAIGLLALAILHRDVASVELGGWFGDTWNRNLVQLRMHPAWGDWDNSLFHRVLGTAPQVFTFDSVWQVVEPERLPRFEVCPDCGGNGALLPR